MEETEKTTWDDPSNSEREQKAKKEANDFIHKQFALRKNPQVIIFNTNI